MKKIILVFLLGYGSSCLSQQKANEQEVSIKENAILASMDENATTLLRKSKAYSVSIGIVKDGKTYAKHYGEIDKGKGNKATNEILFEIASVTKVFTGTLMAKAVLEGKVNLNDDIRKYLNEGYPNLEYQGNPIKIKDLITHRSGILTPFPDTKEIRQKYSVDSFLVHKNRLDKSYTKNDFFSALRKVKVDTLPGTTFKYGALGPELCAHILENIYGKSYESQLKETIFDKSEMKSTKIHLDKNDILANGYNGNELLMANLSSNLWGASKMLKSTMADIIEFMKSELDTSNKVVAESHREIYENGGMGYFWEIQKDSKGNISYLKDGGSNGTQNILKIYPQYNLGFSIIINKSDKNSGTYLEEASEGLLDDLKSFDKKSNEKATKTINFDNLKSNTEKMMHKHNLKGLSVAVFENYKIIWTNEWGVKAADSEEKIDKNTAYSTASISKPIIALVCAILEEKGLINLDEPISKYLKRWQLPQSDFTKDTEVTWKHLLSHTAGTSQGGFEDYYQGDSIPTIVQSLQGKLLPRSKEEIKFLFKPGTNWEYSGGGYVIIQCALEDHLGKPLAQIVKETLLDPLKLQNSTMSQPNEKGFLANIAKVHNSKGEIIRTGIPITPQVAPSGLWSTPTDLATIAIEVQKALLGKGNKVISTAVAKKVTDIVTLMGPRGWSYGWQRSLGWANQDWFSHDGSNTGVGGELLATMKNGNGIAILANGDKPNRFPVMSYVENNIIKELSWNVPFDEKATKKIPEQLSRAIIGYYTEILFGYNRVGVTKIFEKSENLYLSSPYFKENMGIEKCKMFYMGNNTFKIDNYPNLIQFNLNQKNVLDGITIFRESPDLKKLQLQLNEIRTPETKVTEIFTENKYEEAVHKFEKLKLEYPTFNFENVLNNLGYSFYNKKQIDLSVKIFNLNCVEYPKSANVFDSLGEIYEIIGELELAKRNYKESLKLNPENNNAKEMIKKIGKRLGDKS